MAIPAELVPFIPLVGGGLVGWGIFLFVRGWWRRRLRDWERAAKQAGLTDLEVRDGLFDLGVRGRAGDLLVRIESYHRGKHENGVRITIQPEDPRGGGLSIRGEGLGTAIDRRLSGARETEVGDAVFDAACFVQGPPALAMAQLSRSVRLDIASLVRGSLRLEDGRAMKVRATISGGALSVELRHRLFQASGEIDALLAASLRLGRALRPPGDVAERLAENLQSEADPMVRARLAETLGAGFPSHPKALPALRAACADPSDEVRLRAALVTPVDGRATLLALVSGAEVADGVRARAIAALGPQVTVEQAERALERALGDAAPETACASLEALGRHRRCSSEPLLLRALDSGAARVSLEAARALRVCGTVTSVGRLLELAREGSSSELRQAARLAVGGIQSRLKGAAPGQLALAATTGGGLSVVEAGERLDGALSLAGETVNGDGAAEPGAGAEPLALSDEGGPERGDGGPRPTAVAQTERH